MKSLHEHLPGTMNSISSDTAVPSLLDAKQRYFPWKWEMCPSFGILNVPELLDTIIRGSERSKCLSSLVHENLEDKENLP